jgi:aminoglycoside phosphotransferase (APT) family kinase protein
MARGLPRPARGARSRTMSPMSDDREIAPALHDWFATTLGDPGPFALRALSGGNSNETLLLTSPGGERIVRRPPHATIDAKAHNMAREHRVLTALDGTGVPAPTPLGFSEDPAIAPGGLLVMERIDGVSLTDALPAGVPATAETMTGLGEAAVDALARLHSVDWEAAGLEGFGRPDGFLERQVGRWRAQYERYAVRDLPRFGQLAQWLGAHTPATMRPGILHGDFHLDNCLYAMEPEIGVAAIIDWEMATIGDPLLDLGLLLAFWGGERPDPPAMPKVQGVSRLAPAPSRAALAQRYAEASGRSIKDLDFYLALAFWKLAAIVEGAYANHLAGKLDTPYARALEHDVPRLLEEAAGFAGVR